MTMSPSLRNLSLTAHVSASVGWLGAVVAFLALALAGLLAADLLSAQAAYLAMATVAWWVIVPLALAALATGLVQSLGTRWGLLRHWWVVVKLVITVLATVLLLVHLRPIDALAHAAAHDPARLAGLGGIRLQLVANAAAAALALVVATVLSVYKPPGLTRYGARKEAERRAARVD